MGKYAPKNLEVGCPCGVRLRFSIDDLIEDDTNEYEGAIWQKDCGCGRSYTIEIAQDPDYS